VAFKEPEAGRDRLVSGSLDRTIPVWDLKSGQALRVTRAEGSVHRLVGFFSTEGPFCLVSSAHEGRGG
jgi:WD40 repeat protein